MAEVAVSTIHELDVQALCGWCGMSTPVAVTCQSCGSPVEGVVRCRYCRNISMDARCPNCREVLVRLWRIAQESPDSRFLFADVL